MRVLTVCAIVLVAFGLTVSTPCWAAGGPQAGRTFQLYTAPLGPSIEGIMDQLKPLLTEAGRRVTDLKIIQRINAGKITGVQVSHETTNPALLAKWHSEDVYVNVFGNAFNQAWQVVRFQKMADKPLIDVEIIQQINIGKVTGLRLYFADR